MSDNDSHIPSVTIIATVAAPEIEEQQEEFSQENPDLAFMSVADANDRLAEITVDPELLVPGTDVCYTELTTEQDGVALEIEINIMDAHNYAPIMASIMQQVGGIVDDLVTDPVGEHRRQHIETIMEDSSEEDSELREELETMPLADLCRLGMELSIVLDLTTHVLGANRRSAFRRLFGRR